MKIKIFKIVYLIVMTAILGFLLFRGEYEMLEGLRDVVFILMFVLFILYGFNDDKKRT